MSSDTAPVGRGLSRWQAVPLAVGSIAGSGILFLPSAVYAEAGRNSLLVWMLATLLCLPMLLMFQDLVRAHPGGTGIEAFIRAGLGDTLGRCVPIMFLFLVSLGLPAGALVAGRYAMLAFGAGPATRVGVACCVLGAALAVNLAGARANTRVQHAGAAALVVMAVVLLVPAAPEVATHPAVITPEGGDLDVLLPGVLLAFWAFAGFENLTFLSAHFRDPRRDFLKVSVIALTGYGLLTMLLTAAIAAGVGQARVDTLAGLLQLAGQVGPARLVTVAVALIAIGAMVLNAVAWIWGVSQLVTAAAGAGTLPPALAETTASGVPRRAISLLSALFLATGGTLALLPGLLVDALAATSGVFVLLYILCIASYVRLRGITVRTGLNLLMLTVLVASLVDSGWRACYGIVVLLSALLTQLLRRPRSRA